MAIRILSVVDLFVIFNELGSFIVILEYLVPDEARICAPGQEVKDEGPHSKYNDQDQGKDAVRFIRQKLPI